MKRTILASIFLLMLCSAAAEPKRYAKARAEVLAQSTNIRFAIAIARHKNVAQPEWLLVLFQPLRRTQGLLVADDELLVVGAWQPLRI